MLKTTKDPLINYFGRFEISPGDKKAIVELRKLYRACADSTGQYRIAAAIQRGIDAIRMMSVVKKHCRPDWLKNECPEWPGFIKCSLECIEEAVAVWDEKKPCRVLARPQKPRRRRRHRRAAHES